MSRLYSLIGIGVVSVLVMSALPLLARTQVARSAQQARAAQDKSEDDAARAASDADDVRLAQMRQQNARQIRDTDAHIDQWMKDHPPPKGKEAQLVASYDNDTGLLLDAHVSWISTAKPRDLTTDTIDFGADGQPLGPMRKTEEGKVVDRLRGEIPEGGQPIFTFSRDADGNEIITDAEIIDARGHKVGDFHFNGDGIVWKADTWNPETGQRTGSVLKEDLRDPPRAMGGPLDVPVAYRIITQPCEPCRAKAERYNALATAYNMGLLELRSLSDQHQHAFPEAQKPLRMRFDHVVAELAATKAAIDAALAEALACPCPGEVKKPIDPVPPPPALADVEDPKLGPICTEEMRNAALKAYDAVIARANANVFAANSYQQNLGRLSASAASDFGRFNEIKAINDAIKAYQDVVNATYRTAIALAEHRAALAARPLDPCSTEERPKPQVQVGEPPARLGDIAESQAPQSVAKAKVPEKKITAKQDDAVRKPIKVGSNGKVGSGAHGTKKALGMLGGLASNFLGGGSGGGGGGPRLAQCRIKESEQHLFTDPGTGISLKVGAKRSGDMVTVFADIDRSPDSGTFQGVWLGDPEGNVSAPARADICKLWGEWSLSVSWTRTEYVDGQKVSEERGGYGASGRFDLPGMVSSDSAPQGLWKQLGFSNASHGARQVALTFKLPAAALTAEPVPIFIHVTRPKLDPVVTQPFVLIMRQDAKGALIVEAMPPEDMPSASRRAD
jgi:hypothetical protein